MIFFKFIKDFKIDDCAILEAELKDGQKRTFTLSEVDNLQFETEQVKTISLKVESPANKVLFEQVLIYNRVRYHQRNWFYFKTLVKLLFFIVGNIGKKMTVVKPDYDFKNDKKIEVEV